MLLLRYCLNESSCVNTKTYTRIFVLENLLEICSMAVKHHSCVTYSFLHLTSTKNHMHCFYGYHSDHQQEWLIITYTRPSTLALQQSRSYVMEIISISKRISRCIKAGLFISWSLNKSVWEEFQASFMCDCMLKETKSAWEIHQI